MGDCGCGGGAATTVTPHKEVGAGQRSSCPVEECGCDTCVRIRIVKYLPWLSASDIAVGAHIPGGAMVVPVLLEREPDLTPPWMWLWWEDGGGTGFEAPATREERRASSQKVVDPDNGGAAHTDADDVPRPEEGEEEGSEPGSMAYWENKLLHMRGDEGPTIEQTTSVTTTIAGCLPLPVTVDPSFIALLGNVCVLDLGTSVRYKGGLTGPAAYAAPGAPGSPLGRIHFELPPGYKPTRSRKEMREYCLPEWEAARTVSWGALGARITVGPKDAAGGLYWAEGKGMYHHAIMYALATLHGCADLVETPAVFSEPCRLDRDTLRSDIEDGWFSILVDRDEVLWNIVLGATAFTSTITIGAGASSRSAGGISITAVQTGAIQAFTFATVIRLGPHKFLNAALADYHFWWAWRLYSYGMDHGDDTALEIARLSARAALSEIAEIAALLLHEYSHVSGGYWEDSEPIETRCVNCCHYLSQWTFRHKVLAEFALPVPRFMGLIVDPAFTSSMGNGAGGRFDLAEGEAWNVAIGSTTPNDECDGNRSATHCDLWTPGHGLTVSWSHGHPRCWVDTGGLGASDSFNVNGGCGTGFNR